MADTKVFTQTPHPALRPFVRNFLVVEHAASVEDAHLPELGLIAAFTFRGECRFEDGSSAPRAGVTGLWDRLRHHAHRGDNAVVVARFTAGGAAAFFRQPLDELANATVALESLTGDAGAVTRLSDQLAAASTHAARVRRVEALLLARLAATTTDPLVAAALDWIRRAPASARIDELVRHIGLSQSALERRFRRVVGLPPKRFASLVRLKRVEQLHAAGATLTTIAHAAGYFDQSHFIHDFKRVTGSAPEAYFSKTA